MKKMCAVGLVFALLWAGLSVLPARVSAAPVTPWPDPDGDEYGRQCSFVALGPLTTPAQVWSYTPVNSIGAAKVVVAQDGSVYLLYTAQPPASGTRICVEKLSASGSQLGMNYISAPYSNSFPRTRARDMILLDDGSVIVGYSLYESPTSRSVFYAARFGTGLSLMWNTRTRQDDYDAEMCLVRDAWNPNYFYVSDWQVHRIDMGGTVAWNAGLNNATVLCSASNGDIIYNPEYSSSHYRGIYRLRAVDGYNYIWEYLPPNSQVNSYYTRFFLGSDNRVYVFRTEIWAAVTVLDASSGGVVASFGDSDPNMRGTHAMAQAPDGAIYRLAHLYAGQQGSQYVYKAYLQKFGPAPGYSLLWSAELGSVAVSSGSPSLHENTRIIVDAEGNAFVSWGNGSKLLGVSPSGQILWSLNAGVKLVGIGGDGRLYCTSGGTFLAYNTPWVPQLTVSASGGLAWDPSAGRGYVALSWNAVRGATGYKVHVFDGYAYREFDVGSATTWDSRAARIYPSEEQLASYPDNTVTSDIFNHVQGGLDLRDDPRGLYRKTSGTTYDDRTNYWFRVSAYNPWAYSPQSDAVMPTLPNRTDPVAPSGTLRINDGAAVTGSISVTLQPQASDSGGSGLQWMQFSNDNSVWSTWYPYAGTYSGWSLSPGEGTKTVYARFKDGAGNVSPVAAAQIYLRFDMTPPEAGLEINGGAETVTSTSVTLTVKAFDDGTPVERLKVRFSNDGQAWTAWESFAPQKAWTLASGEGSKVVYVQVKDENGNLRTAYAITNLVLTPGYSVTSPSGVVGTRVVNGQSLTTRFVTDGRVLVGISAPGAASVRFSTDGVIWSDPEPVYSQRAISLPQGDGQREVFVRFDTGPVYVLEFTVDREPPLLDLSWLGGATVTAGGSATLVVVASDAISAQSALKYSYSVDGGATWTAQAAYAKLVTVTFSGSGPKVVLFRVYDQAGNFAEKAIGIRN